MIIAVSGAKGAGVTFVAVNLAGASLSTVTILDMDVASPCCKNFIHAEKLATEEVFVPVPRIDSVLCDSCGECLSACNYKALRPFRGAPQVFPALCHSGGSCRAACPRGAISLAKRPIGAVETGNAGHVTLVSGAMSDHEHRGGILKKSIWRKHDSGGLVIVDIGSGYSFGLERCDAALFVAEPSMRGVYELSRLLGKAVETGIPCGVVINRSGPFDSQVEKLCRKARVPVLLRIPFDNRIARALDQNRLLVDELPRLRLSFRQLLLSIRNQARRPSRIFLMGPSVHENDIAAISP